MLNPNICKRVRVQALEVQTSKYGSESQQVAVAVDGAYRWLLEVNELRSGFLKPGKRYAYLKYSITSNRYYVTAKV